MSESGGVLSLEAARRGSSASRTGPASWAGRHGRALADSHRDDVLADLPVVRVKRPGDQPVLPAAPGAGISRKGPPIRTVPVAPEPDPVVAPEPNARGAGGRGDPEGPGPGDGDAILRALPGEAPARRRGRRRGRVARIRGRS